MKTIDKILTAEEMQRMVEPNEFGIAFFPLAIFEDFDNFHDEGPVYLTGSEINWQKQPTFAYDMFGLRGNLPKCRQHQIGGLSFYALTNGRRIVVFEPSEHFRKIFPVGYMVREDNAVHGPSFALHHFPHIMKEHEQNPFLRLVPEAPGDKIVCVLSQLHARDISALVGFSEAQWRTVYNMLCAWIPE